MASDNNLPKKTYLTLNHDTKIDLGRYGNRTESWDQIFIKIMDHLDSCENWNKEKK